ncbi:hypothetical protein MMC17_000129 [Xylographa soralifera]|nr:hypothetical protein [Xylographa soralifera]
MASPLSMIENVGSVVTNETKKLQYQSKQAIQRLLTFEDLPAWMQGDPYIRRGYRKQLNSLTECYESLFYLHNESVNIWSHLVAGIFFFALLLTADYTIFHTVPEISVSDAVAVQTYLAGATGCLFLSAFYHCTTSHSHEISRRYLKLDYLGIVLNITSTCISAAYFGLHGDESLKAIYISVIAVCGATTFWFVLDPNIDGHNAAFWRALVFIALGCSGFAPIVHMFVKDGPNGLSNFPISYICGSCVLYLTGTAIYVTRSPEKRWPGLFDYWGASHQIFHVLVTCAQTARIWRQNLAHLEEVKDSNPRFAGCAEDVIEQYKIALSLEGTDKQLPAVLKKIIRYEGLLDCMWDEAQVDSGNLQALQDLKVQQFLAEYGHCAGQNGEGDRESAAIKQLRFADLDWVQVAEMLAEEDAARTAEKKGPPTGPGLPAAKPMHADVDRASLAFDLQSQAVLFDIRMDAKRITFDYKTSIHQHIKDRNYGLLGKEILMHKRQLLNIVHSSLKHLQAIFLPAITRFQDQIFEYLEYENGGDYLNDITFDLKPKAGIADSQKARAHKSEFQDQHRECEWYHSC